MAHVNRTGYYAYGKPVTARVPEWLRKQAQEKAKEDGITLSFVINLLLEGYSEGHIELPRIVNHWEESPANWEPSGHI